MFLSLGSMTLINAFARICYITCDIVLTLFSQLPQPVVIIELVCVLPTLPAMSNVVLGRSLESGGLASLARLPGITYLMICSTALTQMHLKYKLKTFLFQRVFNTD